MRRSMLEGQKMTNMTPELNKNKTKKLRAILAFDIKVADYTEAAKLEQTCKELETLLSNDFFVEATDSTVNDRRGDAGRLDISKMKFRSN